MKTRTVDTALFPRIALPSGAIAILCVAWLLVPVVGAATPFQRAGKACTVDLGVAAVSSGGGGIAFQSSSHGIAGAVHSLR